jgi:hypothetical protein
MIHEYGNLFGLPENLTPKGTVMDDTQLATPPRICRQSNR